MKNVFSAVALAGLVGAFALPAVAQDAMMAEEMTCGELSAMDEAGQMKAMGDLEMAAAKAEGKEMTSEEAMSSGEMMMAGTIAACEGHNDMMAIDAMKSSM
jgi:hypothetical protein